MPRKNWVLSQATIFAGKLLPEEMLIEQNVHDVSCGNNGDSEYEQFLPALRLGFSLNAGFYHALNFGRELHFTQHQYLAIFSLSRSNVLFLPPFQ
jgi:hypothetical protein